MGMVVEFRGDIDDAASMKNATRVAAVSKNRCGEQEDGDEVSFAARGDSCRRAGALAAGLTGISVSGALPAKHPVIDPAEALFFEHQSNVEPKSVAAIITVYFHNSHADVLLTKILEGWKHDGGPGPALKLASIYIDQPEGSAFGLEILEKHGIRRFNTIEEALTTRWELN